MAEKQPLIAYKGFDRDWTCRGFKYEVGKSYEQEKPAKLCKSGFHACEYPLDIFYYYEPTGQMALVELDDVSDATDGDDSKRCARKITIKASLTIPMLVAACFEYTLKRCAPAKAAHVEGDQEASFSKGTRSASSATGYSSASSATGDSSASSATGDRSASSATGDSSASSATGYRSASSATGYRSASSATGKNACALNIGRLGRARASAGAAIVLCNHDDDGNIRHIRASKVGENGVKPDTWYVLNDDGQFEEAPAE